MSRYYYHTEIKHTDGSDNTWLKQDRLRFHFADEDITFLSFDEWVVLYNADPEGWHMLNDEHPYKHGIPYITCPAYLYPPERKDFQIIKFRTKRDYKKWIKFMKKQIKNGQDFANLKEYQKLLQSAQRVATERVEKSKKEVERQYEEMLRLIEKTTKEALK